MPRIEFPDWGEVLTQADLPDRVKQSFEITVRWYLSFCRRGRADVTVQSARDFMAWAAQEKHPQGWQLEQWKEALRWFFRAAKDQRAAASVERAVPGESAVWLPEERAGWPEWKVAFLTTLRRRKYSYRTEQSYLVWIEQFARHVRTEDLRAQGERQVQIQGSVWVVCAVFRARRLSSSSCLPCTICAERDRLSTRLPGGLPGSRLTAIRAPATSLRHGQGPVRCRRSTR